VTYQAQYGQAPAIMRSTKDGKKGEVILAPDKELGDTIHPYFEKDWCYSNYDNKLVRTNMVTGEKEVIFELADSYLMQFLVTEKEYCVLVTPINLTENIYSDLWVSSRDKVEFRKIDYYDNLDECFAGIYKFGDTFYPYQVDRNIYLMNEDFEYIGLLPDEIRADRFFIVDDMIYYVKQGIGAETVCSYNLKTGEQKVLIDENIDEMNVLENRYVVGLSGATDAYLYDLQTGELVNMLDDEHLMG